MIRGPRDGFTRLSWLKQLQRFAMPNLLAGAVHQTGFAVSRWTFSTHGPRLTDPRGHRISTLTAPAFSDRQR
jgi:hypothetical protein